MISDDGQNVLGEGAREPFPVRFHLHLADRAVLDHHGKALGADSAQNRKVLVQSHRFREGGVRVGQHPHLGLGLVLLAPRCHHKRIIHRHAHNLLDPFFTIGVSISDVAGKMRHGASRREGSGNTEDQDLSRGTKRLDVDGICWVIFIQVHIRQ